MSTDYTTFVNDSEETKPQNGIESSKTERAGVVINCRAVNVRKAPHKNAEVLGILPVGQEVDIKSNHGKGWVSVFCDDIPKGYIMEEFIKEK